MISSGRVEKRLALEPSEYTFCRFVEGRLVALGECLLVDGVSVMVDDDGGNDLSFCWSFGCCSSFFSSGSTFRFLPRRFADHFVGVVDETVGLADSTSIADVEEEFRGAEPDTDAPPNLDSDSSIISIPTSVCAIKH